MLHLGLRTGDEEWSDHDITRLSLFSVCNPTDAGGRLRRRFRHWIRMRVGIRKLIYAGIRWTRSAEVCRLALIPEILHSVDSNSVSTKNYRGYRNASSMLFFLRVVERGRRGPTESGGQRFAGSKASRKKEASLKFSAQEKRKTSEGSASPGPVII